jgi:hypothetical protein
MDAEKEAQIKALVVRLNQYIDQSVTLQDEELLQEAKVILEELNLLLSS